MTHPNLIAAHDEECRRRSIRLGTNEKRGKLPGEVQGIIPVSDDQIRIRTLEAVGKGRQRRTDLVLELANSKRCIAMLDLLVRQGVVSEVREWKTRYYEMVK